MRSIVLTEFRLHARHGTIVAVGAVTAMWIGGMLIAKADWRPEIGAWALFFDLAAIGLFFVPALTALERANGVAQAHRLVPIAPGRFLLVRISVMTVIATGAGFLVLSTAAADEVGVRLIGVLGLSILTSLVAIVAMGKASGLPEYLGRLPFIAIPLLLPPLLEGSGLVEARWPGVSPVTSGMRLIRGEGGWAEGVWLALWCVGAWLVAVRTWSAAGVGGDTQANPARWHRRPRVRSGWPAWRSTATVDRRTLAGDRMLLLVLTGIPIIALAVRWIGGPGTGWLADRWGLDIRPDLPAVWAFVLVAHTPMMIGAVSGLVFLEDRDLGVLPVLATTPWSLAGLLRWRLVVTGVVSAVAVLIGAPIAGAVHRAGTPGMALAAAAAGVLAALVALLIASLAKDRVQGMAIMKVMGLPFYAPIAMWFVGGAIGSVLLVVPSGWVVRSFWASSVLGALGWSLGGIAWSVVLMWLLMRRLSRSVV